MQAALNASREGAFRADINGLRGLSVALVVAFHLHLRGADGGFIGVDVFFVISGYLMTKIILGRLAKGDFGYWRFIGARVARIWPALSALVLALLALGLFVLPPMDLRVLAEQSARALTFTSNHFFLDRSGYQTRTADTHWLLHTWSLSVEWQFYMLYPLLLMGLGRHRALPLVLAGLLLASWGAFLAIGVDHPSAAFFLLLTRAWEMLAGGLAFLAPPVLAVRPRWRGATVHASLAAVLGVALWMGMRHASAEGAGAVLAVPVVAVALILWAGDGGNRILGMAPLQKLGTWSYSIYLWHWPLIVGLRMIDAFVDHAVLASAGVVALAVACGALSYRLVEGVEGAGGRRLLKPVAAMGAAAALTTVTVLTAGFAFRSPEPGFGADYAASVKALYYPERCGNFMKTAAETMVCQVDKGTRRRVLVIGDSHAEHLYPWFVAHSAVTVDFFTQPECPPVPHLDRMQAGFHCMDYAQAAWQRAADPRYDTLVLAARWATVGAVDGAPYCHAGDDGSCAAVAVERRRALVNEELGAAMRLVLSQGKTIVMLRPTPEAAVRVPERITRELFWRGRVDLSIDQAASAVSTAWLAPLFDGLRSSANFHLVGLDDRLCSQGACRVFDVASKRPIYFDESHFDPVWIAHNAGVFAPFVGGD